MTTYRIPITWSDGVTATPVTGKSLEYVQAVVDDVTPYFENQGKGTKLTIESEDEE